MQYTQRHLLVSLLVALLLVISGYGTWMYLYTHDQARVSNKPQLPKEGLAANDTNGMVPGDPENGVRVLKEVYRLYTLYRAKHGQFPSDRSALDQDVDSSLSYYGYRNDHEYHQKMLNPDDKYSDDAVARYPDVVVIITETTRPDGTAFFSAKKPGTRDVIQYTTTYFHDNIRRFSEYRTTSNPVGFYQVLWDDGTIEQVPYDKILYVQTSAPGAARRTGKKAFPGQAGVPDGALTYDQYYYKSGWKKGGPRGTPGGKGVSYDGKSYR